jgi:hypothetical protein
VHGLQAAEDGADGVGAGDDGDHAEKAKAANIDLCRLTTLYFRDIGNPP